MPIVKETLLEQQPTQPIVVKQHYRVMRIWRWLLPLILGLLLISSGLIALAATLTHYWLPSFPVFNSETGLTSATSSQTGKSANVVSPQANQVVSLFMGAMMHKDWTTMWTILSPDAQPSWQGERDFAHFEQAKFGPLKFVNYHTSLAIASSPWRDPDTTQVYPYAAIFFVSLQATAPEGLLSAPSNQSLKAGLFDRTLFAVVPSSNGWKVLVAGPADQDAPILVPAKPQPVKVLVPIFMYHHVSNQPTSNLLNYGLTVTTTDFEQQLDWLYRQGYHSINQTELFDALYYGKALPVHPVMLTFDDGYEDVYTDAFPALLAHHYRGVFYIITGMIGGRYMTWNQVRTLALDGMQISSHTVHHINVGNPPPWISTQAELIQSKQTLESQLHQPIQFFCYPSGEPFHHDTVTQQAIVLRDLFADGYVGATLDPVSIFSAIQDAQFPYQLNRIRVSGGESLAAFIGILDFTLTAGKLP